MRKRKETQLNDLKRRDTTSNLRCNLKLMLFNLTYPDQEKNNKINEYSERCILLD
jgi:hypothetical protein